jgi:hypothetical protein
MHVLEELCESVEAFQSRRMSKVLNEDRDAPDWKVFSKAAIDPRRRRTRPREMLAALRTSNIETTPAVCSLSQGAYHLIGVPPRSVHRKFAPPPVPGNHSVIARGPYLWPLVYRPIILQ